MSVTEIGGLVGVVFLESLLFASAGGPRAFLFFTMGKRRLFVTRCVSEGYQAVSLAYAAGYESLDLLQVKKGLLQVEKEKSLAGGAFVVADGANLR